MIQIDPYKAGLAAAEWHSRLETYITKQGIHDKWETEIKGAEKLSVKEVEEGIRLVNDFCENLTSYSLATKEDLELRKADYEKNIKPHNRLHKVLRRMFIRLYSAFTVEKIDVDDKKVVLAYRILNILDQRTCPYCNRSYTFAVYGKGKKVRPQFDHFFDKANYPMLAVSFYNLVPSCPICNYTKRNSSLHFNPYFYEFLGKFKVYRPHEQGEHANAQPIPLNKAELLRAKDWGDIRLDTSVNEEKADMEKLGIDGLYKKHDDYLKEMMERVQAYNDHACDVLVNSFQGAGHSAQQVKEFVWGKDIANARNRNHPLSKLTRDVLEQAGIFKDIKNDSETEAS